METKQQVAIGLGLAGAATVTAFLISALTRREKPAIGFSLMIENPPAGTTYWAIKQGMFALDEAWWYEGKALSPYWLQVSFLASDYNCPVGDPDCEGIECWFEPEDGHNYILDCQTCEFRENPTPPPPPPPPPPVDGEPYFISAEFPDIIRPYQVPGDYSNDYDVTSTWYLPLPWVYGGKEIIPVYYMSLQIYVRYHVWAKPIWYDIHHLNALPADMVPSEIDVGAWGDYIHLIDTSGKYTWTNRERLSGEVHSGTYPVRAVVDVARLLRVHADGWTITVPQESYIVENIGEITVENPRW